MQGTTTTEASREGHQYETPSQGDWRVGELGQIFHANGTKVAECYLPSADFLIAAAPALLKELQAINDAWCGPSMSAQQFFEFIAARRPFICAAIDKATGWQS